MRIAHFTAPGFSVYSLLLPLAVTTFVIWLVIRSYGMINFSVSPEVSQETGKPLSKKDETHSRARLSAREMARLNLFGQAREQETSKTEAESIPETKLQITLVGAFTSTEDASSSALITSGSRNKAERYFEGEQIPGNAILEEVHPNYVVIKRGGRLEKLLFPAAKGNETGFRSTDQASLVDQPDKQNGLNPEITQQSDEARERLQKLRSQLLNER